MKSTYIYILYPMSLTSMRRSCRLLCYRTPVEVEWLPITREIQKIYYCCYYITITWNIYMNDKLETGRNGNLDLDLVQHSSEARITLVPPVSVKDQPLHWILVRSQTYYPEHILVYGRREGSLLSCHGFRLFPDRLIGGGGGRGPYTALSPGLGVQVQTGTQTPGQEGDGLVLLVPGVQVGRVFLGYPAGGTDS